MTGSLFFRFSYSSIIIILLLGSLLVSAPVSADDIPTSVIGRYDDWDLENSPTVGMGLFPTVEIEPKSDSSSLSLPKTTSSSGSWVTISPFSATLGGQETFLIAGYISGARSGATITIAGKRSSDLDFSDIAGIKPDENGLFVWAVPAADMDIDLFRAVVTSGKTKVLSNAIRFSQESEEPIVKPVLSPSRRIIPMAPAEDESSGYGLSRLSISASSTSPGVGDDVSITGRLIDEHGAGIGGATVSLDETGYPGAAEAEPFDTTTTGSDGRFEFTIRVSFADTVGLVANYAGDDTHSASESNTILFTSHE